MIYIYASQRSPAAFELVKACAGQRLRNFDGLDFWLGSRRVVFTPSDILVPWGSQVPDVDDVRVLNPSKGLRPDSVLKKLTAAGVVSVVTYNYPVDARYIPRLWTSEGGSDLLNPPEAKDAKYYVRVEDFKKVYRIHSFAGKSIRAGVKVIRDGFTLTTGTSWKPDSKLAHPWVMTHEAGWKIDYDFNSTKPLRALAHKAVKVLGLTFAAVDIGEKADGSLVVIKVDSAPKIDGGTVIAYAKSIQKWAMADPATVNVSSAIEEEPDPVPPPAPEPAPMEWAATLTTEPMPRTRAFRSRMAARDAARRQIAPQDPMAPFMWNYGPPAAYVAQVPPPPNPTEDEVDNLED